MERKIRYWSYMVLTLIVLAFTAGCGSGTSTPATTIPAAASLYYGHSVAFRNNSTLTWGYNAFGQLGNNTTTNSAVPVRVLTLTNATPPAAIPLTGIIAVSAGGNHTLALKSDGTVYGWGFTAFGQTGNNLVENGDPIAKQVLVSLNGAPLANVARISAGGNHSLALDNNGRVWTWGLNGNGQLGNGTTITTTTNQAPLSNNGLSGVKSIAAGGSHSLAIFSNTSTVTSWGYNAFGQLGDGSIIDSSVPVQMKDASGIPVSGIKAIAAGGAFSVAIDRNDNVMVWGYNGFGQLGEDPAIATFSALPVTINKSVFTTGKVVAIAAGLDHVLALTDDGTIWAWGYNYYGQLGVAPATTTSGFNFKPTALLPTAAFDTTAKIDGVSPILAIGHHNLARRKSDGKLVAWGQNTNGQLGDGTTTDASIPVVVSGF